jgi:hypothetical protein
MSSAGRLFSGSVCRVFGPRDRLDLERRTSPVEGDGYFVGTFAFNSPAQSRTGTILAGVDG